jgi:2-oxoglutarate ferredoxin oxidoreductase subunit alpha
MSTKQVQRLDRVVIRFAGDSGDGMQLTGDRFTSETAVLGNDLSTLPNFPAEIRAPQGTLPGVSSFQLHFADHEISTPGDAPDVLVAMNPAALKANLPDLPRGATLIVDTDEFTSRNLKRVGYAASPIDDGSLDSYHVHALGLTSITVEALTSYELTRKDKERAKNMFALGLLSWLYHRPTEGTERFLKAKFATKPQVLEANLAALRAGWNYGETTEDFAVSYEIAPAPARAGTYRNVTGNTALAFGLVAAAHRAARPLVLGAYPITPASDVLHLLATLKRFGVTTIQAEDEIAGIGAALGAAYGGAVGVTTTSGPGVSLKGESIGLAVSLELPLVICDIQRGGPSTGLPTKTEQADLFQALFGRNSESPVGILAPATPAECFHMAIEACRMAVKYMCPVFLLSDGYLANGAEPWRIPEPDSLPKIEVKFRTEREGWAPYLRNEVTLSRDWAIPGTPGMEHRIGGIEKSHIYGNVNYDPENHEFMCRVRAAKIQRMAQDIPEVKVHGPEDAQTLVIGWGSTYGAIRAAVEECQRRGLKVARAHLRHLNPFPSNLGKVLSKYKKILVPEMNLGQLLFLLRAKFLVDAKGVNKVQGKPFRVSELIEVIEKECK